MLYAIIDGAIFNTYSGMSEESVIALFPGRAVQFVSPEVWTASLPPLTGDKL